MISTVN